MLFLYLITQTFSGSLASIVKTLNHIKSISLNNQQCITQPALIKLYPNECTEGLCYYQSIVKLDRCIGICNTLNDLSNIVFVRNKTEDLNLSVSNIIKGINEKKIFTKHISCQC